MAQVLIAGAGPTGLTLAIELLRRNISVRIVDAAPSSFTGSRGKGIQPRTLEIFDLMGIADAVVESSCLYPFLKFHVGPFGFKGGSLGTRHPSSTDRPYPNMLMVSQSRTEEILREKMTELGGQVEYNNAVVGFCETNSGVKVTLESGDTIKSDYLVACDGGRSTIRSLLDVELLGQSLDHKTMIVADLEIDGLDRDFWHVWPRIGLGLPSLCPLPQSSLFQLQASAKIAAGGLGEGIRKITGKRASKIVWQSEFRHQTRMVNRYRVGRVLLAGDAAHLHPPSGAQGLNTSIQDAWNLGWKLAAALHHGEGRLLDSYEEERLPVAAAMLNLTGHLHRKASRKRGELTNQLSLSYSGSSLSVGEARDGLSPGDRMPDFKLSNGSRLFEQLRHPHPTQLMKRNGEFILIRPDGYIGEIGTREIKSYFGQEVAHLYFD